ncbi:gag protease polyprotein [Tanacetum coccineum]
MKSGKITVELDEKTVKDDEEAVKRIKGEALKEKDDPGAFIFPIRLEGKVNEYALADTGSDINTMPYRIYETLGREEMKKIDRGITMINHTQAEAMGKLSNVLCQVGVTTIIAKFLILDIPIDPTRFDVLRTAESDSDDEEEYVIKRYNFGALIYGPVWKKAVSFLGSLPIPLKQVNWKPDYKGSYTKEEEATRQWRTEIRLTDPYNTRLAQLLPRHIYSPCIVNWDVLNRMGCDREIDDMLRIRVCEAESDEEIFTSMAWIRAFNINEPIYAKLCHDLNLLEFARRLGLYQAAELEEDGFNVYFVGGVILPLSEPIFEVIYKISLYSFVSKDDWFISKLARKCMVLTEDMVRSLSASVYCRDLDSITLRDLIDYDGKLIPEDPQPGVPRVGIPRPPRASMQDLYDRMGRMEIRQDAIERMEYREPTTHLAMLNRSMTTTITYSLSPPHRISSSR